MYPLSISYRLYPREMRQVPPLYMLNGLDPAAVSNLIQAGTAIAQTAASSAATVAVGRETAKQQADIAQAVAQAEKAKARADASRAEALAQLKRVEARRLAAERRLEAAKAGREAQAQDAQALQSRDKLIFGGILTTLVLGLGGILYMGYVNGKSMTEAQRLYGRGAQ
jgi:MoxR-like ATPase